MKNLITLLLTLFITFTFANAQTINDVPLSEIDVEYIQIVGTGKFFSNKVKIDIDFGQHDSMWSNKDTRIKDKNGNNLVLNSMIDALNFMTANGYEYVNSYAITIGNQNVYHYLLSKRK